MFIDVYNILEDRHIKCKLYCKKYNRTWWITFWRRYKNRFDENIINELKLFVDLYNISKHVILSNDELDRTFHADDAIICYLACKIVRKKILLNIDEEIEKETYEIDWNKYGTKVIRF